MQYQHLFNEHCAEHANVFPISMMLTVGPSLYCTIVRSTFRACAQYAASGDMPFKWT